MFRKILIANRGEIACRVMRTAQRLGIATIAVYSDADADALHVAMADAAWRIGPAPARQSYLDAAAIVAAAVASGAEAVHPGYGFLSENADFAAACAEAGLVFIGPPPAAIRAMGSKAAAKTLMQQAGVPLVPGYHGAAQDAATLAAAAAKIGYPVLIKASAGGGGKGMRIVERAENFAAALAGARGEAASAFGDDRVLIEKYLTRPRHIEIQLFADSHGGVLHLFERDCSIQRRHQKVIEEAPAPGLAPAMRAAMGEAAVAAARAVGYIGAGTVEFIVEDGAFYFMEMNTRLQVEHAVSEMITGQDLVEWQLRVAAGEALPLDQSALRMRGHAIEARLYAEDPARDFLPSIGTLRHLREPAVSAHVRIDTGVRAGDRIGIHYDPMIAKLIVWDADRAGAIRRLASALAQYEIGGLRNNLALLRAIAAHPGFAAGGVDTGFLARHPALLTPPEAAVPRFVLGAAALIVLTLRAEAAARAAAASADPHNPWAGSDGWRLNLPAMQSVWLGETILTASPLAAGGWRLSHAADAMEIGGGRLSSDADTAWRVRVDGAQRTVSALIEPAALEVFMDGEAWRLRLPDPLAPGDERITDGGRICAPIPATVRRVLVAAGDAVTRGQALLVLEAMKMELTLTAPTDGTIAALRAVVGQLVSEGEELVELEAVA